MSAAAKKAARGGEAEVVHSKLTSVGRTATLS
jgi:hypothetical protein